MIQGRIPGMRNQKKTRVARLLPEPSVFSADIRIKRKRPGFPGRPAELRSFRVPYLKYVTFLLYVLSPALTWTI